MHALLQINGGNASMGCDGFSLRGNPNRVRRPCERERFFFSLVFIPFSLPFLLVLLRGFRSFYPRVDGANSTAENERTSKIVSSQALWKRVLRVLIQSYVACYRIYNFFSKLSSLPLSLSFSHSCSHIYYCSSSLLRIILSLRKLLPRSSSLCVPSCCIFQVQKFGMHSLPFHFGRHVPKSLYELHY